MIAHETNSFSPLPTSQRAFREDVLCRRGGTEADRAKARAFPGYADLAAVVSARGDELVEGLAAWTQPSGPATAAASVLEWALRLYPPLRCLRRPGS